jgi:hypothetical protein
VESLDPNLGDRFVLIHELTGNFRLDWRSQSCTCVKTPERFTELMSDPNCLGLFEHHAMFGCKASKLPAHYESFTGTDTLLTTARDAMRLNPRDFTAMFEAALIRMLIVDERLDRSAEAGRAPELRLSGWSLKRLFEAKGISIAGREFSGTHLPEAHQLLDLVRNPDGAAFHFLCVHRGVLDKLKRPDDPDAIERILDELTHIVPNVIVHSGRAGTIEFHASVRQMPLSNVADWLHANRNKSEIVDVLSQLRRV